MRGFDDESIKDWRARHSAPDTEVFSDSLYGLRCFVDAGHAHKALETIGGRGGLRVRGAR